MSLSTQTQKRLPTIKQGLIKGLNRQQIGAKCGVTEKTIDRDFKAWVESGEFEIWLKEEWIRIHGIIIHEDPVEAYRQLTKLVSRAITRRVEMKEEIAVREKVDVTILAEYVSALDTAVERDIQSLRARKQMDTRKPQTATA